MEKKFHEFMKIPAEFCTLYGEDECGAGKRRMQSSSTHFKKPRLIWRGSSLVFNVLSL
jgi:hypothetical protein